MEGGDGLYGYEYTIQEVVDKPTDKVAYGDKVYTSYSMKTIGVDRGDDIITGEQLIHVINTDQFLASDEIGSSVSVAEARIKEMIGKGVGDTFRIKQETPEWSSSYLYTILQIDKAVEYGDTIKATVRCASLLGNDMQEVSSQENISLELLTPKGIINLAGYDLNMSETMKFLREIQGKSIGDKVYFYTLTDSQRRNYQISILDVSSGEAAEGYYEAEALMMSEDEKSLYFYNDNEIAPIYYAIVTNPENNMLYEYVGGNGDYYSLVYSYSYEPEYDELGRLIKETYGGDIERICEYKYNELDICVEVKMSLPNSERVHYDYYDDKGNYIRSEEFYESGSKTIIEYVDGNSSCVKRTYYDEDGNVSTDIDEYDEWGFLIIPEISY